MNGVGRKFKNLNQRLWFRKTCESTVKYCNDFLKLSGYDQKLDTIALENYLYKIVAFENEGRLHEIEEQDFIKVFPQALMGHIHEYQTTIDPHPINRPSFEPKHLMYKYAIMRDEEHKITYEFLFEYDLTASDVEIYYGIKAISDYWNQNEDSQELAERFLRDAEECYETIVRPILRKQSHKSVKSGQEFKTTNNVSNGTYWLFWLRVESGDTLDHVKDVLKNFYNDLSKKRSDYKKSISNEDMNKAHEKVWASKMFFAKQNVFSKLLDTIERRYCEDKKNEFIQYIETLTATPVLGNTEKHILEKVGEDKYKKYKFNVGDALARILFLWFFDRDYFKWLESDRRDDYNTKDHRYLPDGIEDVFFNINGDPIDLWNWKQLPKTKYGNLSEREDQAEFWRNKLKLIPQNFYRKS